ncbi:CapA family protein [Halorussus salinisoli]|uniref:CapA family protein n=1 Tax=Halorussus salinisoli TaxID=2558242 RepID=UPI0010C22CB7|nr:CapA family protein [Halorussus salinisoli]
MNVRRETTSCGSNSILIAGDSVLSPGFNNGSFSDCIQTLIRDADKAIANIEAPIDTQTPTPKHGPVRGQTQEDIITLSNIGFDIGTLANNHMMDHGVTGLDSTIRACSSTGLSTVGAGESASDAIKPIIEKVGDVSVAIFNVCGREFGIADKKTPGVAWIGQPGLERTIQKYTSKADFVIVVAHGGLEYIPIPPRSWQRTLRSLVEAGADAVVCHHPHVAQSWEIYQSSPIVYSLGNFAFHLPNNPATRWSYLFEIEFNESNTLRPFVHLIETKKGNVQLLSQDESEEFWNYLLKSSDIIKKLPTERGYWQEVATNLYTDHYKNSLEAYGNGRFLSLLRYPVRELDLLTQGIIGRKEYKDFEKLDILNYIQYESHRDVVETSLRVQTGVIDDERTPEIEQEVEDLLSWTDPEKEERRLEVFKRRMKTVFNRASSMLW